MLIGIPILAFFVIIPALTYLYFVRDISDIDRLMNRNNTGIVVYANDAKTVIYSEGSAAHHNLVPIENISTDIQNALIASEDKNFYKHNGFSVLSTIRAVYGYVVGGGKAYGGSTITQQLAKITLLGSNRSFLREYQAFSVAVAIENSYTKEQILNMYLNSAYFGEGAFGVEDAAKVYFGTTPKKLTLAQSAMLIGLLPAPSIYSPISGNPEYAKERQGTVLQRMVTNGFITEKERDAALKVKLKYVKKRAPINSSDAPHFAQMVINELYEKYGEETVARSGFQVVTTLDKDVQSKLRSAVAANMPTINYNQGHNAAAVAIDPKTGEVRGLVGSYDWSDPDFGEVNIVTSLRQPGSSFKPIYYAHAMADGVINPATVLKDERTDFGGYVPLDADKKFRGDVTVRQALNLSLNIPAVEVMQKYGISKSVEVAQRMGLTSIDKSNDYGLSLALGSAEVTPLALTNAYATFANEGKQFDTSIIKTVKTKYNEQVYAADASASRQVISPQGAFLVSDVLSDNAAKAPLFGGSLNVYDAHTGALKKVAVKTGTTNESRDAWTVGYTPDLALGVWVGNNDNAPMLNGSSIMAGPIFTKAMGSILAGVDSKFTAPSGVVQKNVCRSNYGLANIAVSGKTYTEWFLSTNLPSQRCTVVKPTPTPTPTPAPTVDPSATQSVVLSASPSDSASEGDTVTLTATVTDTSIPGTVLFMDGDQSLGQAQVVDGSAVYSLSSLSVGQHLLAATFTPLDDTLDATATATLSYEIQKNKIFPFF